MTTSGYANEWLAAMNLTEAKIVEIRVWCHKNGPATKATEYLVYPPGPQATQVQALPDEIQVVEIKHYDPQNNDGVWYYHTYMNGWDEYWIPDQFVGQGIRKLGAQLTDEQFDQVWVDAGIPKGRVPA
jgi:hypothetical protein